MRKLGWVVLLMLALGVTTAWAQEPVAGPGDDGPDVFGEELLGFDMGMGPGPGPMMGGGDCMMGGGRAKGCEGAGTMGGGHGMGRGCGMGRGGHGMMGGGGCMMGGGPGMGRGPGGGMLAEELKLTDTQREKLAGIRDAQARKGIQAHADLQVAMLDLHKLIGADKPNKVAIDAQIDRVARMRADLQKARVASQLEARSVLTPEQQEKLRTLRGRPGTPMECKTGMKQPQAH